MTMTLVSTVTVGAGGAANITFSSIPASGTDILVLLSPRGASDNGFSFRFNGDSGSNYTRRRLIGSGSTASSTSLTSTNIQIISNGPSETANTFASISVYIPNYAGSTAKSVSVDSVMENNATAAYQGIVAGLWSGTGAISSIVFTPDSGNFAQYSTASLYTVTKGSGGASVS